MAYFRQTATTPSQADTARLLADKLTLMCLPELRSWRRSAQSRKL
jgi:hypothetical protein